MTRRSSTAATIGAAALGLVLLVSVLLAPAGASPSTRGLPVTAGTVTEADYGDAPDGVEAGYLSAPEVIGLFPSLEASDGIRHTRAGRLRLGKKVDVEGDSRQVDRDKFDDGFATDLRPCKQSDYVFIVDARRLPAGLRTQGHTLFLNAWFDWNRDGDWFDESSCESGGVFEDVIANFEVDMRRFANEPIQAIRLRAPAGTEVEDIWHRASITLDEPVAPGAARGTSTGLFTDGETEDYLPLPAEPFGANCSPNPAFVEHGKAGMISFVYTGVKGARFPDVHVASVEGLSAAGIKMSSTSFLLGSAFFGGDPPRGIRFETEKDKPDRTGVATVRFKFKDRGRTVQRDCLIYVLHDTLIKPPGGSTTGSGLSGGQGRGPVGGGVTKCNNGEHDDADGLIDAADPGCNAGPGATYDPQDHSEGDLIQNAGCETLPDPGMGFTTLQPKLEDSGTTMIRHILRNLTTGQILIEKGESDADFASGSMSLGSAVCGPGTTANASWSVSGTNLNYEITITKDSPGVTPTANQIGITPNTR